MGGVVKGIFGDGGYGGLSDAFNTIAQQAQGNFNQQQQNLAPYNQAGLGGLSGFQQWLAGMQDPSSAINKALGGYQESDYAKNLQQSVLDQMKSAQATSGALGSGGGNMDIGSATNKIMSNDVNDYLNRYFNINNQYGSGQQYLTNVGMQSNQQLNDALRQMLEMMAQSETGGAQANIAGKAFDQNIANSIFGALGGLF